MKQYLVAKILLLAGLLLNASYILHSINGSPWNGWTASFLATGNSTLNSTILNDTIQHGLNHDNASNEMDLDASMNADQSAVPIIVDLTGELGNHLNHIAHGRAIQTMLWNDYHVPSYLVLRRYSNDAKYYRTQRQLKQCFPNLRNLAFHEPRSSTLASQKTLDQMQRTWLGESQSQQLSLKTGSTLEETRIALKVLVSIQNRADIQNKTLNHHPDSSDLGVSIPFLHTSSMINREFMDQFYDDFRDFFEFDDDACCGEGSQLYDDEAVFHFRNFLSEIKQGKKGGLEELSAQIVATKVFQNSTTKKVAIATRFAGRQAANEYLDALNARGFSVRFLTTNDNDGVQPSAMQDFCAMRKTTELVGTVKSTFVVWAALLGNTNGTARLYSVDSPWTREKSQKIGKPFFRTYNWTHPELQRRIHFELYQTEESKGTT